MGLSRIEPLVVLPPLIKLLTFCGHVLDKRGTFVCVCHNNVRSKFMVIVVTDIFLI